MFLILNPDFSGVFAELPRSIADAAQFYRAEERNTVDKLFWSQFGTELYGAFYRSTETVGRAAQDSRTGHEGINNLTIASRSYT